MTEFLICVGFVSGHGVILPVRVRVMDRVGRDSASPYHMVCWGIQRRVYALFLFGMRIVLGRTALLYSRCS